MIVVAPLALDPAAPLARAHPLAKIAAAGVLMLALFVTLDPVTVLLVLAALALALPFSGLPGGPFARRVAPLAAASLGIGLFNTVFAPAHDVVAGVAAGLRLFGIAFAGVLAVATIDPTDLADALVEHLHAPPRFVLGAVAAWRLAPIFGQQWWILGLARRARGVDTERSLSDRLLTFPGRTFSLLVTAIRRGTELALAMDARGFGRSGCRTLARPRAFGVGDVALLAAALAVAIGSTALSVALGSWRPLIAF